MKQLFMAMVILVVGGFLGVSAWRWLDDGPAAPRTSHAATVTPPNRLLPPTSGMSPQAPTTTAPSPTERTGYVVSREGTPLTPSQEETAIPIAGGMLLPVLEETVDGYRILDPCNREGWVPAGEVEAGEVPDRGAGGFDQAVFVIDPGHGLPDYGAIGPSGLAEAEVNLDVATRVVQLLRSPRDVDWATGSVTAGNEIPAAATAVLTRSAEGPDAGQYQAGLTFRATVANALNATALVSIHHNSAPETRLDHPGSEAFVSVDRPGSPRLGGLMVEELRDSFGRFQADWMGSTGSGLISRVDAQGEDYYTILARSEVPAAIVEGAYISNHSEEALAMTDEFRQTYAEAVYRALVRFVTTDDDPIPAPEPELWEVDRPGPSMSDCRVPTP